jgi:hypothetical protein
MVLKIFFCRKYIFFMEYAFIFAAPNPKINFMEKFIVGHAHAPEGLDAGNPLGFSAESRTQDGYPVLLGLLQELPGSLPQHLAWVHFQSLKAVETFLKGQNRVDFAAANSPQQAKERAQAKAQVRRAKAQKKATKGGSIFEILNVYGGNIEAYRAAKMAEENENRAKPTPQIPPQQLATSPAQAMASSVPFMVFRSINLLPRLVAIAFGREFLAAQEKARVEVYHSADAYIASMRLKFPQILTGNAAKVALRNARSAQRKTATALRRAEKTAQRPNNVPIEPLKEIFTNAQHGIEILNIEPIAA